MGSILHRQNDTDFSGLELFASVSCLLGTGFIGIATYLMSQEHKTWRV
jgi:hypothetical protein